MIRRINALIGLTLLCAACASSEKETPNGFKYVVISNGVINLIPDKEAALSEIIRVLKPAGRLMVADQIAAGNVQKDIKARLANWFQ